jgi:hypothetical protein
MTHQQEERKKAIKRLNMLTVGKGPQDLESVRLALRAELDAQEAELQTEEPQTGERKTTGGRDRQKRGGRNRGPA